MDGDWRRGAVGHAMRMERGCCAAHQKRPMHACTRARQRTQWVGQTARRPLLDSGEGHGQERHGTRLERRSMLPHHASVHADRETYYDVGVVLVDRRSVPHRMWASHTWLSGHLVRFYAPATGSLVSRAKATCPAVHSYCTPSGLSVRVCVSCVSYTWVDRWIHGEKG